MAINLADIRAAVNTYLDTNSTVTIGPIQDAGNQVNPNEAFSFEVSATNTGGVRLKNVRLRVEVDNATVGKIQVKGDFLTFNSPLLTTPNNVKDLDGGSVIINQQVRGIIIDFATSHKWDAIEPGESLPKVKIFGKAGSGHLAVLQPSKPRSSPTLIRTTCSRAVKVPCLAPAN
jgi:hypothetical protein